MEICKICKENGKQHIFKDNRGLAVHLRTKHRMSLEEYRNAYKQVKPIEKEKKEEVEVLHNEEPEPESVDEPVVEKTIEVVPEEPEKEINVLKDLIPEINGLPKIIDCSLLNMDNFVAMFRFESTGNETYKKIIGIGSVIEDEKTTVSALVIGDDGSVIPVVMIPEFVGIVEVKSKIFTKTVKSGWIKQKKTSKKQVKRVSSKPGLFTRKRKSVPKNVTNEELVEGFSKILARRKK